MTHRKYSRTRNRIHRAMARNPGERKPLYMRLKQAAQNKEATQKLLKSQGTTGNRSRTRKDTKNGGQDGRATK